MNRRDFLLKSALASTALIVGDEMLELLDRLAPRRLYIEGADFTRPYTAADVLDSRRIADAELRAALTSIYSDFRVQLVPTMTPLLSQMKRLDRLAEEIDRAELSQKGIPWTTNTLYFDAARGVHRA